MVTSQEPDHYAPDAQELSELQALFGATTSPHFSEEDRIYWPEKDAFLAVANEPRLDLRTGTIVTVTGEVLSVIDYESGMQPRYPQDEPSRYTRLTFHRGLYLCPRFPTRCLFQGWTKLSAGIRHPGTSGSSGWMGEYDEGAPIYFETQLQINVAVVALLRTDQRWSRPFKCAPSQIKLENAEQYQNWFYSQNGKLKRAHANDIWRD